MAQTEKKVFHSHCHLKPIKLEDTLNRFPSPESGKKSVRRPGFSVTVTKSLKTMGLIK